MAKRRVGNLTGKQVFFCDSFPSGQMTPRERLTLTYRGGRADKVPWTPIITNVTLSTYPQEIIEKGIIKFTQEIGGDVLLRGGATSIVNGCVNSFVFEEFFT